MVFGSQAFGWNVDQLMSGGTGWKRSACRVQARTNLCREFLKPASRIGHRLFNAGQCGRQRVSLRKDGPRLFGMWKNTGETDAGDLVFTAQSGELTDPFPHNARSIEGTFACYDKGHGRDSLG